MQQFIELVRDRRHREATAYSKKFLAPQGDKHLDDIMKAAALLAFMPTTKCQPYMVDTHDICQNSSNHN